MKLKGLLGLVMCLVAIIGFAQEDPQQAAWNEANSQLAEGKYREAALSYSQLINSKFDDPKVYMNRGIANFHLKHGFSI